MSLHVLGSKPANALFIRVKNAQALAARSGLAGAFAAEVVPETIQNKVLSTIQGKVSDALLSGGVDADVLIVPDSLSPEPSKSDLWGGMAIGGLLVGAGAAAWKWLIRPWLGL